MIEKDSKEKVLEGIEEIIKVYLEYHFDDEVPATIEGVKWKSSSSKTSGEGDLYFILSTLGARWEFEMEINENKDPIIHPTKNYIDVNIEEVTKALSHISCGKELRTFVEDSNVLRLPIMLIADYETEEYPYLQDNI